MKNAREVVGLPVIELRQGGSLGRVQSLVFNSTTRRVDALEIGERSLLKSRLQQVPFSAVRSFGSDAVTLHGYDPAPEDTQAQDVELQGKKLSGSRLITVDGTLAGTVDDFSFSTKNGELVDLYVALEKPGGHLKLPVTSVENFGRDFIVISGDYLEHSARINNGDGAAKQLVHSVEAKAVQFAINREAGQDVFDEEGGAIVRKGEKVTVEVIELAREKNRLAHVLLAAGVGELLDGLDFTREKLDTGSRKLLEAWQALRNRSHEWMSRRVDDERAGPTGELRELWLQLQGKLSHGGHKLEETTLAGMKKYVEGKTLANPVHDEHGNLLAAKGELVTAELADRAEGAGRLTHLFLSAAAGEIQSALTPIKNQLGDMLNDWQKKEQ
ncbi:MAG: PRC-barrel domain-containing protein [Dethiobacter sp.]|nr:PRC-barrel domain-containing protein [Dethiobacter sp.]